jgi:hypothetical protein
MPWPHWAYARDALYAVASRAGVAPDRSVIGRIRYVDEGLSNVVYHATIRLHPDRDTEVAVKLPAPWAGRNRDRGVRAEAALLRQLQSQPLWFAVSRPLGEVPTGAGLAMVQEWVEGREIDLRAPRFPGGEPWKLMASLVGRGPADRCHRLGSGADRRSRIRPGDRHPRISSAVRGGRWTRSHPSQELANLTRNTRARVSQAASEKGRRDVRAEAAV